MLDSFLICRKDSEKIAMIQGERSITYKEWYKQSIDLSQIMINACIDKRSSNIGVFLPNSIKYGIVYFSILFSKKVIVPIGVKEKKTGIQSVCEYCELDYVITDSSNLSILEKIFSDYKHKINLINIDTGIILEINKEKDSVPKSDLKLVDGSENSVAIMLHTSGTTSNPKRVMLTHQNLMANVQSNIKSLQLREQDITLITLPMHFGYCNTAQFLTHVFLGASIVIMDNIFMAKQFFWIIQKYKVTNFTAVPTLLLTLLQYNFSSNYDISSLRYICFGGGKINVDTIEQLLKKFPTVGFVQTYGQTECSPRVTALLPEFALSKIGSVGTPIPNVEVKIIDEEENELEVRKIGQIVVRGQNVMRGYYKKEELTEETIKNGWINTGDLGYFDEDRFLYICGRIKNMIISGGINIYPEEVEELIITYPGVKDVLVYGKDDPMLGEIPIAKIVTTREIDIKDVKKYCFEHLASYKVPVEILLCEKLEKTYNGKLARNRK